MHTTRRNERVAGPRPADARTVEQLLEGERKRARAALSRNLEHLGAELSDSLERGPLGRHPWVAGSAALALGVACAPAALRGTGTALRLTGPLLRRMLLLALGLRRSSLIRIF